MRGHDHTGITVPDMKQAVTFFEDVLGCKKAMSFGPFMDDKGNFMKDMLDVNPRAVITQITMIRCGFGSNIELFSYTSPDQQVVQPKNSDVGGYHIAFYVDDIKAADKYLRSKGVWTLFGPVPINQGPAAGQTIVYFKAPWGLQMEAISYPDGMAYEKNFGHDPLDRALKDLAVIPRRRDHFGSPIVGQAKRLRGGEITPEQLLGGHVLSADRVRHILLRDAQRLRLNQSANSPIDDEPKGLIATGIRRNDPD